MSYTDCTATNHRTQHQKQNEQPKHTLDTLHHSYRQAVQTQHTVERLTWVGCAFSKLLALLAMRWALHKYGFSGDYLHLDHNRQSNKKFPKTDAKYRRSAIPLTQKN